MANSLEEVHPLVLTTGWMLERGIPLAPKNGRHDAKEIFGATATYHPPVPIYATKDDKVLVQEPWPFRA
ncbi:hypothetical protein, partial [Rhodoferax sp.]|uniref:hypothetical protein n=1 Tax=Rhodoferax sp. TaxID=50421 RepID=UPI003BB5C822